jgi:hypothetical protein
MATKRAATPKSKPELHFEQVPVELVKTVAKPEEKKPKVRHVIRRSKLAGR